MQVFPFTRTLRGRCRLINWPSFNSVVSPETGRAEERERQANSQSVEQLEHTYHLSIKFTILRGCSSRHPKQHGNQRSLIIDHNTIVKKSQISRMTKMWQRHKVHKCCWKNGANQRVRRRVATNLQSVKDKIRYLRCTMK